jgi:signal peptidase I
MAGAATLTPAEPDRRPPLPAGPTGPSHRSTARWRRRLVEDAVLVVIAVVAAVLIRTLVAQVYYIPSSSMVPQLRVDDRVVVSRLAYHLHPVHRGDIIVFRAPPGIGSSPHSSRGEVARLAHGIGVALGVTEDQTVLIKRVIGLPGETVTAHDGSVYVDGDLVVEPYLPRGTTTSSFGTSSFGTSSFGPVRIPSGFVWVMGDDRGDSEDSRVFGPVAERTIIGRAIWKVWPPWRTSFL